MSRRGTHVLKALAFEFGPASRPLISVDARPVGVVPWLFEFLCRWELRATLEGDDNALTCLVDGLWKNRRTVIVLSPATEVDVTHGRAHWYLGLRRGTDLTIKGSRGTKIVLSFTPRKADEGFTQEVRDLAAFIKTLAMNASPHDEAPAA